MVITNEPLNREVNRLHNCNQIQNKEDTTVSTFVSLLLKTRCCVDGVPPYLTVIDTQQDA
jgi:hypothetical protein